ncbi:MAG: insulinase family protein, partial [Planctomycetes bacterium]|nr:insulinase family protein [Planctomycetota bacterium]
TVFANGLTLVSERHPHFRSLSIGVWVKAGTRHEHPSVAGVSHFLEHMLFKGTPTHPHIDKLLQAHGASGNYDASTAFDRTNYYETMPAGDANLEFGIKLEADRLVNSRLRREDLVSEMTVVRNEFEKWENMPGKVLREKMLSVAYEWHNYGKGVCGNRADIERVPVDGAVGEGAAMALLDFLREHVKADSLHAARGPGEIPVDDLVVEADGLESIPPLKCSVTS